MDLLGLILLPLVVAVAVLAVKRDVKIHTVGRYLGFGCAAAIVFPFVFIGVGIGISNLLH